MLPNAVVFDEQDKSMQCKIPVQNQRSITSRPIPTRSGMKVAHHKIEESDDDDGDQIPVLNNSDSYYEYYSEYSEYSDDEPVKATKIGPRPPENLTSCPRAGRPRPPSNPVVGFRRGASSSAIPAVSEIPNVPEPTPKQPEAPEEAKEPEAPSTSAPPLPMGKVDRRVSYHIEKKSKGLGFGGADTFTVTLGSAIVAKIAVRTDSKNLSIQMENFNGVVAVESKDHTYYLRENSVTGQDICTVRYMKAPYDPAIRACYVYLHKPLYGEGPTVIRSKQPTVNKRGVKCLNFGKRAVIPSMKNCLLVDDDGNEYAAVMRTTKTSMCVDVIPEIPPYCAVVIGVSAFVCRKV